jgi:cell division protein FtsN
MPLLLSAGILRKLHPTRAAAERGGTFFGIILGLVVGLGVALGMAVYITKMPVPFTNKGQSRTTEQDAAEAKKNKDWDPNAMIQGKNPVRAASGVVEAASAPAKITSKADESKAPAKPEPAASAKAEVKAEVKAEGKPAPKEEAKPENKPEPKPKPAPSADPLGDLVKAKSANVALDPFTYQVQTGAFRSAEDAESHRAKLALLGMDVKVTEREQSGRTVYRVRAGPFERKEDAEKSKERLEAAGIETVLVRVQR